MSKVHAIKSRIKSVKNINQITKAMEMVAASKLRRAQEATLRSRLYAGTARELLAVLRQITSTDAHPLFIHRTPMTTRLLIVFSSDRGLAGAYNSNLLKGLLSYLEPNPVTGETLPLKLIIIGQKGAQFVSRLRANVEIVGVYPSWPAEPSMNDVRPIVATAIKLFTAGEIDKVSLLYTDFVSTVRQVVTARTLLPVVPTEILPPDFILPVDAPEQLFEPDPNRVLDYIVPRFLETQVYQASLEALASEQSMRMMAMKNASDNAEDITSDLTLTYNGARQAAITQELAEITAGAEAIK